MKTDRTERELIDDMYAIKRRDPAKRAALPVVGEAR